MATANSSYSKLAEKEFFENLVKTISGVSEHQKRERLEVLEDLQRRIKCNLVQDCEEAIRILLDMARNQGYSRPESELIVESFLLFINKDDKYYKIILGGLTDQRKEASRIFLVFSKLVLHLNHKKKQEGIKPLLGFLMNSEALNDNGVSEVYDCLVRLGNENLSAEIADAVSSHLDSLRICEVVFSARLIAKFGNNKLLPNVLKVLEKSEKGYFNGSNVEIEEEICQFIGRLTDVQGIAPLLKLLKMRASKDQQYHNVITALARVLDSNPNYVADILEVIYDERRDEKVVSAILRTIASMEKPKVDVRKLLANLRIDWLRSHMSRDPIKDILIRGGKTSKPVLFEILREDDSRKYDFALQCLKEIGISTDELASIFPQLPMLQIYNYFFKGNRKFPVDLNQIWREKQKLGDNVPGNTKLLEHLLLHIFAGFDFVTMNLGPFNVIGVDIVSFYPETLDLFIVGCTIGVIKDDLAKMDALVKKMKIEMPSLFEKCAVTPIVVCSEIASISHSDKEYADQNRIVILQSTQIDTLLEMLNTSRKSSAVIDYLKIPKTMMDSF
jgi:hypothetical protein